MLSGFWNWLFPSESRKGIPKTIREKVWSSYHGNSDDGKCYCCGYSINKNCGWHCAHVIPYAKGGPNTVENLRVCCARCNLSMGNQNLYAYIRDKELKGEGRYNIDSYFLNNQDQKTDVRTNNWKKSPPSLFRRCLSYFSGLFTVKPVKPIKVSKKKMIQSSFPLKPNVSMMSSFELQNSLPSYNPEYVPSVPTLIESSRITTRSVTRSNSGLSPINIQYYPPTRPRVRRQ